MSNADTQNLKYFILPKDKFSVAVCNSFELHSFKILKTIQIYYNSELEVYFHISGQFLNEWKKDRNKILSASKENVDKKGLSLNVYDTDIILKFEKEFKLAEGDFMYDDCMIGEINEVFGQKVMECLFSRNNSDCSNIINPDVHDQIHHFLHHNEKCISPGLTLSSTEYKSRLLKKNTIATEPVEKASGVVDLIGDLGLAERPTLKKPLVNLIFPRFTKITEVISLQP